MEVARISTYRNLRVALLAALLVASLVGTVVLAEKFPMESGSTKSALDSSREAGPESEPADTKNLVASRSDSSAMESMMKSSTGRGLSDAGNISWLLAEGPTGPSLTANQENKSGSEQGYLDPLIDPAVSVDPPLSMLSAQRAARLPGFANAEYRLLTQNTSDSVNYRYREHGVATQLQQETTSYGRFDFIAALTNGEIDNPLPGRSTGGHFINLAQRDFALTNHLQMDTELGDIRARVPTLLTQGYFIRLPEPLIEGLSSEIRSKDTSLRVTSGKLGTYQGRTFPVFTSDYSNGSATSLSGNFRINPQWLTSLQLWDANNVLTATGTDSFTSMAGTLRYVSPDSSKAQLSVLHSSSGATGFWLDGEKRFIGWRYNLGLYRMDPNLQWVDRNTAVLTDTQGIYARTATRDQNSSTSLGMDWTQTNVDSNPLLSTRTSAILFGNYNYQLTYSTSVNGYLGLGDSRASGAGVDVHDTSVTARGSTSTRYSTGTSAWLLGDSVRSGSNAYNRLDASWDYYWNTTAGFSGLRNGLSFAQQTGSINDFRQASVRAAGNYSRNNGNVGASVTYGYLNSDTIDSNRSTSVVLSMGLRFAANWRMNADLTYNDNALFINSVNTETRISDTQLLVSLRYDANWGRSIIPMGKTNGAYGYGNVRGVLFLDQNGNGVRDAGEPGVPNVTIALDGGYTTETNGNGEFSFNPVPSGTHQLQVNVANVPLPWNLPQERPFDVNVNAREQSTLDIPLVSMRPN